MLINHTISWAWLQHQHATSEVAVDFAIAFWRNFSGPAALFVEPFVCLFVSHSVFYISFAVHAES